MHFSKYRSRSSKEFKELWSQPKSMKISKELWSQPNEMKIWIYPCQYIQGIPLVSSLLQLACRWHNNRFVFTHLLDISHLSSLQKDLLFSAVFKFWWCFHTQQFIIASHQNWRYSMQSHLCDSIWDAPHHVNCCLPGIKCPFCTH